MCKKVSYSVASIYTMLRNRFFPVMNLDDNLFVHRFTFHFGRQFELSLYFQENRDLTTISLIHTSKQFHV